MQVCSICGSYDVDTKMWCNINSEEVNRYIDDYDFYCNDCDDYVEVIEEDAFDSSNPEIRKEKIECIVKKINVRI
ncbi:MAG: hypothetical protein N4A71_08045 [Carboxylicivirga sp.]|jgi:hypothetical protein|nr:hypothetical protein [Carboxylicivirga sp.]